MGRSLQLSLIVLLTILADAAHGQRVALDTAVADAVRQTREAFASANVKDDAIAVTVIDLRDPKNPVSGSYRGDQPTFPASVVKLFYLAYAASHEHVPDEPWLWSTVAFTVIVSVLLHGVTATPAMARLDARRGTGSTEG